RGADGHEAAAARQAAVSLAETGAAERVEHDVDAPPPGEIADHLLEVVPRVVDGVVEAVGAGDGELLVLARGAEGDEARVLRELESGEPDPARDRLDEQALPGPHPRRLEERVPGGEVDGGDRRRLLEAH